VGMMFAVIILLTAIGFVLYLFIGLLRRLVIPWHESMIFEPRTVEG
jgi:ABC-type nitrate/sulfonate/bicarbonate transport system permease component